MESGQQLGLVIERAASNQKMMESNRALLGLWLQLLKNSRKLLMGADFSYHDSMRRTPKVKGESHWRSVLGAANTTELPSTSS